jgi:hypothetical protein
LPLAQVIWPPVKEGAQSFYATVKKIEFSPDHYRELFLLYQEANAGGAMTLELILKCASKPIAELQRILFERY